MRTTRYETIKLNECLTSQPITGRVLGYGLINSICAICVFDPIKVKFRKCDPKLGNTLSDTISREAIVKFQIVLSCTLFLSKDMSNQVRLLNTPTKICTFHRKYLVVGDI